MTVRPVRVSGSMAIKHAHDQGIATMRAQVMRVGWSRNCLNCGMRYFAKADASVQGAVISAPLSGNAFDRAISASDASATRAHHKRCSRRARRFGPIPGFLQACAIHAHLARAARMPVMAKRCARTDLRHQHQRGGILAQINLVTAIGKPSSSRPMRLPSPFSTPTISDRSSPNCSKHLARHRH